MALMLPPWYFANETDNYTGTPSGTPGTTVTPGTSNADGSSVTLLTALAHDVHYLVVGMTGYDTSGAAFYTLLDIMLDPAGGTSWASFIDDLVCGFSAFPSNTNPSAMWYHLPVVIKSGTSIGARARTSHTTTVGMIGRVLIYAMGNPSRPDMWWCGSGIETLGVTPASSIGTSITPGNSGSFGSWTSVGSTTAARYGAVQYGFNGTDAGSSNLAYHFQIGHGSEKLPGSRTQWVGVNSTEECALSGAGPIWCDIPSGTQMQVRATCSGTAEVWAGGVAIYGVY